MPVSATSLRALARQHRWLLVALAIGLAIRIPLFIAAQSDGLPGDQLQYSAQAHTNASGLWYQQAFQHGHPAADHPPLTSAVLTPATWLFHDGSFIVAQRFTVLAFGLLNIWLLYLLGRRFSPRVGVAAAFVAAIDAHLFLGDVLVLSETLGITLMTTLLLVLVQPGTPPTTAARRLAIAGGVLGLLLLTRAELLVLVPLICVWVWWQQPQRRSGRALARGALPGVVALLVIAPWVLWNASRFEERAILSTNDGFTLLGANCDDTYYGDNIGGYSLYCALAVTGRPGDDSSQVAAAQSAAATSYAKAHLRRLPLVAGVRLVRQWEIGFIGRTAGDSPAEGRPTELVLFGSAQWWMFGACAIVGARRIQRRTLVLLALPLIVVSVAALTVNAQWRVRSTAEPTIVLLAALGLVALIDRLRKRQALVHPDR